VQASLPEGVVIRPVYDRSDLIRQAIRTLQEKLVEEAIVVALVCLVFLWHARSALVAILTLPIGVLLGFIAMRMIGINADIMSLGGIAIAIGAMIDAAIVMIENTHKHLERAARKHYEDRGEAIPEKGFHTSIFTAEERWRMVVASSKEVGPALFFALLIITVSFLPVFALEAQEGRLFKPLAWTKTLAMAAASLLAVTMVPVTMGMFIRGRLRTEGQNPVSRFLIFLYRAGHRVGAPLPLARGGRGNGRPDAHIHSIPEDRIRVHASAGRGYHSLHAHHPAGDQHREGPGDHASPGQHVGGHPGGGERVR
jgi:copper/silver efflux system protein